MKAKYALVILLVAVLALVGVGCKKVTGGGQFKDFDAGTVTFAFNAQPTEAYEDTTSPEEIGAKGQFQLVAHGSKTRIHGSFNGTWTWTDNYTSTFFGTCTINGTDVEPFNVTFYDNGEQGLNKGDGIIVLIGSTNPIDPPKYAYSGDLTAGNIKIHKDKKK